MAKQAMGMAGMGGGSGGNPLMSALSAAFMGGFAEGGIVSQSMSGYSRGGVAHGPMSGYPALLHGNEAIVPLPGNNKIPVDLQGAGGSNTNNVTVNVAVDNNGNASQTPEGGGEREAGQLGKVISLAVQRELQVQKRAGGLLSPYGA